MKAEPEASIREAIGKGLEHHRAGRLPQAEAMYRQVLQAAPDQPDALQLLGVLAHQAGRNDLALELMRKAIGIEPSNPHYLNQLGFVLQAEGRLDEALASYRRALALDPLSPHLHFNLALALRAQGMREAAIASYRAAISLKPDYSEAHNNLGLELESAGRLDEALACYRSAVAHRPDNAEAHNNLGNALGALGQAQAALASYQRALELSDHPVFKANFAQRLGRTDIVPGDAAFRRLVARAISEPWARPADLARVGMRLIMAGRNLGKHIEPALRAWPARPAKQELLGATGLAALADDPLLAAVLESLQVCEIGLERFLTLVRHAMLEDAMDAALHSAPGERTLAFHCALARQCFINDFVFSATDEEISRATSLRATVVAALESDGAIAALSLAAVGAYFPLGSLPSADKLTRRSWPAPVAALLEQQVAEPLAERHYRGALPRLTVVDEGVSRQVQEQYEENPYPKWVKLPPGNFPSPDSDLHPSLAAELRSALQGRGDIDILVAGCGTGQESIELARKFPRAQVLAIDLSLASLGYAERKARELGVANLEHAQADIMNVGSLGRRFDFISSVGVLHHLAQPMAGWGELASLLRPGGIMLVGLYSERGRQDVVAARKLIAERGYGTGPEDIRNCRQELMASANHAGLAARSDFYGTSECRDLLFHVQEHRYSLPRIGEMTAALGLEFMGLALESDVVRKYRERFPDDASMTDLDRWNDFEAQFPATFTGMYVFWVRKPPASPTPMPP